MPTIYAAVQSSGGVALWVVGANYTVPAAPSGVVGTATGTTTATITWVDNSTDESSFDIQFEVPAGSNSWGSPASAAVNATLLNATGLPPATAITPRVRATNSAGSSVWVIGAPFTTENPIDLGGTIPPGGVAPTVITHPVSQTVASGALVTFIAAFAGTPTPTVQWRRNGVSIAGATSASYSFTATQADSGASFDCIATNAVGTVATALALLVVQVAAAAGTLLDAFIPFVLPSASNCPWITAEHHVRQACSEWFERTLCWRLRVQVGTVVGTRDYLIPAPTGAVTAKLIDAMVGGSRTRVRNMDAAGLADSQFTGIQTIDRRVFTVSPAPGASAPTVQLLLALKPTQDAGTIPADQFEQYADYIAQGALARILGMQGMKWSDAAGATRAAAAFERHIGAVQTKVARAFGRSDLRVRPQWF